MSRARIVNYLEALLRMRMKLILVQSCPGFGSDLFERVLLDHFAILKHGDELLSLPFSQILPLDCLVDAILQYQCEISRL